MAISERVRACAAVARSGEIAPYRLLDLVPGTRYTNSSFTCLQSNITCSSLSIFERIGSHGKAENGTNDTSTKRSSPQVPKRT
jgi:hypothetical protein